MNFWQIFLLFNLLGAVFFLWPILIVRKRHKRDLRLDTRNETNTMVYQDHMRELERTMGRGEIDPAEMAELRRDLESTMAEENSLLSDTQERPVIASFRSRLPLFGVMLALPLLTWVLYQTLGSRDDWQIYQISTQRSELSPEEWKPQSAALLSALQARVKDRPENVGNWYLLANTAVEQGQFDEAVRAFREILSQQPEAANVRAELAQALFLRAGNTITPEVREQTQAALEAAPNLPTALGLAGIDAYQRGAYDDAISFWQRALGQLDPSSQAAQSLSGGIARAQIAREKSPAATTQAKKEAEAPSASLKVKVALAKNKVDSEPNAPVFVYARAWQGPKMPLAIQKLTVGDLPTTVTLDQSMAMTQGMDLSRFPQVEIVARISSTGSAISASGDWQATAGPIIVASQKKPVSLTISEQVP